MEKYKVGIKTISMLLRAKVFRWNANFEKKCNTFVKERKVWRAMQCFLWERNRTPIERKRFESECNVFWGSANIFEKTQTF